MRFKNLKISQKLYFGFGIFAILFLLILLYTYFNFRQVSLVVDANMNTYQVLQESDGILNSLISMETGSRGFAITGENRFLEPFNDGKVDFVSHYHRLMRLVLADNSQVIRLEELKKEYQNWMEFESRVLNQKRYEIENQASVSNKQNNPSDPSVPEYYTPPDGTDLIRSGKGKDSMDIMQTMLKYINNAEKQKLESKSRNITKIENNTYISILLAAVTVVLLAVFISFLFASSITRPIKMLISATESITKQNYQKPIDLKTDRELGILIKNFNTMQVAIQVREKELGRKNEEIKQHMVEINKASKLKSQFLANMSHELRTPLNSIIGFTTRVIRKCGDLLPSIQLENLKIVKSEADHLLDLINDLLDYSKLEAGKVELHFELFDLSEVVREVNDMVKALMESRPLKYEQELYTDENIMIYSDRLKIKQIVINLMSNAIKYSEQGIIKLTIHKISDMYCIQVKDDGIGITPENLESIFDEFHQVDGSLTRKTGGTGLGLSITKRYTEMLGGRIEVTSTLGVGSCFTVWLPAEVSNRQVSSAKSESDENELGLNTDCILRTISKKNGNGGTKICKTD